MTNSAKGLVWCFTCVILEAIQAVYFGAAFQDQDVFLVGALVFGTTTIGTLLYAWVFAREELLAAWGNLRIVIGMNVTAAAAWLAYLPSIQYIEPAIAFALFSGCVPLATIIAARLGVPEASRPTNRLELTGNLVIAVSMVAMCIVAMAGYSGFVRGGVTVAALGVVLASAAGALIAWMLFYCRRLDAAGVGPVTQMGLRFLLYIVLAVGAVLLDLDRKGDTSFETLVVTLAIGLLLIAFPVYATQRAVSLVPTLVVGTVMALGPLFVFLIQAADSRVDYAGATLACLCIYFAGALIAAFGSAKGQMYRNNSHSAER